MSKKINPSKTSWFIIDFLNHFYSFDEAVRSDRNYSETVSFHKISYSWKYQLPRGFLVFSNGNVKETMAQLFSCEFCDIIQNSFYIEHHLQEPTKSNSTKSTTILSNFSSFSSRITMLLRLSQIVYPLPESKT